MATYTRVDDQGTPRQNVKERYIYGSSRIGYLLSDTTVAESSPGNEYARTLGNKRYECSNHLGNVLVVITDQKIAVDTNSNDTIDSWYANVIVAQDYYPFGMIMPGRYWSGGEYRFGFNGQEKDDDIKGSGNSLNFGTRIYDPRLASFLSIDFLFNRYPWAAPYCFAANNPIRYIDVLGLYADEPKYKKDNWYGGTLVSWDGNVWYFKYDENMNDGGWQYVWTKETGWEAYHPNTEPKAETVEIIEKKVTLHVQAQNIGGTGLNNSDIELIKLSGEAAVDLITAVIGIARATRVKPPDVIGTEDFYQPLEPLPVGLNFDPELTNRRLAALVIHGALKQANSPKIIFTASEFNDEMILANRHIENAGAVNYIQAVLLTESQFKKIQNGTLTYADLDPEQIVRPIDVVGSLESYEDYTHVIYIRVPDEQEVHSGQIGPVYERESYED